jgi:hypothetical protein
MTQFKSFGRIVACGTCLALGFAAALPLVAVGSGKETEFYGAFAAAIVAAAALILRAYYQDRLERQRIASQRERDRAAEAIDLCFWLDHAASELEFIAEILERLRNKFASENKNQIDMPAEQFREVISSHFFEELLTRAKVASQLPQEIAGTITRDIYETFTAVDRVFRLRGASGDFRPSLEKIDNYFIILDRRIEKLRSASIVIKEHLTKNGVLNLTP